MDETLETVVAKARTGASLSPHEQEQLATAVLQLVAELNMRYGWTMQLHIGALRNVNHRLYAAFGPDVGGDTISDASIVAPLAAFLGMLEERNSLPNTILYTLDPTKHTALAALAGSFCGTGSDGSGTAALHAPESTAARSAVPGKVQLGAAWWFNDQKDGMERHMREYASVGLLGSWVGMLTDSRSFLSFPRHEYFRRILCDIVGGWVEAGELPNDAEYTESLVRGICFENAASYFGIPVAT
ncbi:MAG: glucuronate isomerase [Rectinema sp.]|nr:glucuronate isomerase [Rectinema sp.]